MPNQDRWAGFKVYCTMIQVGHPDSDVLCKKMSPQLAGILIVTFLIPVKCYTSQESTLDGDFYMYATYGGLLKAQCPQKKVHTQHVRSLYGQYCTRAIAARNATVYVQYQKYLYFSRLITDHSVLDPSVRSVRSHTTYLRATRCLQTPLLPYVRATIGCVLFSIVTAGARIRMGAIAFLSNNMRQFNDDGGAKSIQHLFFPSPSCAGSQSGRIKNRSSKHARRYFQSSTTRVLSSSQSRD